MAAGAQQPLDGPTVAPGHVQGGDGVGVGQESLGVGGVVEDHAHAPGVGHHPPLLDAQVLPP
jgi:hypothetical protein